MTRVFQGWSRDRDLISRAEHHFERREIDVSLLVNKPYREISQFLAKLSEKSTVNKSTARNSRYIATYLRILLNLYYIPGTFCRQTESVIFFFFFFSFFSYVAGTQSYLEMSHSRVPPQHWSYEITSINAYLIYPFPLRTITTFQARGTHKFPVKESVERVYSGSAAVTSTTTRGIGPTLGDRTTSMPSSSVVDVRDRRRARVRDNRTGNFARQRERDRFARTTEERCRANVGSYQRTVANCRPSRPLTHGRDVNSVAITLVRSAS